MQDTFERNIQYLRLSVTDLCNYRCSYCMPETGVEKKAHKDLLSLEELVEISDAAVRCGVRKIRLTGGEPLARRGIVDLCEMLGGMPGLEELTLTTNGALLPPVAEKLKRAGVNRLNISLDTLDAEKHRRITRCGDLSQVLAGLQAAKEAGFTGTKLNVVLMGGVNDDEIPALCDLARREDYSVRFIELMPIGECAHWPRERFLAADAVLSAVPELQMVRTEGVAELYTAPGWKGTVGLIRPMSHRFCSSCDRIRITADGKLKPCLHSRQELSLRGLHGEALEAVIRLGIVGKPEHHHLNNETPSESARAMHEIGG